MNSNVDLIHELCEFPAAFDKQYELLDAFFNQYPVDRLRELLGHSDESVRACGVWIASELGRKATPVVDAVARFTEDDSPRVRCNALETLVLCADGEFVQHFIRVIIALNDKDAFVRSRAMFFLSNASSEQVEAAIAGNTEIPEHETHAVGIASVLMPSERAYENCVNSDSPLLNRYGFIVASKLGLDISSDKYTERDLELFESQVRIRADNS